MLGGVLFMFSAVKVFVDYGGVYVFQVCFHLFMVLGFVFDLCGVVCVVEYVCCGIVGVYGVVIFILFVIRVVVGVP